MRRLACIVSLVAALFFVPACGALPEEDQPPITASELDRFLADAPEVIAAIQRAALRGRNRTVAEGNRVLEKARNQAAKDLGWAQERFNHILSCCRDVLSRESIETAIDELTARTRDAIPQADRERIHAELQRLEAALGDIMKRLEARTTVAERVFIDERMDALKESYRGDVVVQPYRQP